MARKANQTPMRSDMASCETATRPAIFQELQGLGQEPTGVRGASRRCE